MAIKKYSTVPLQLDGDKPEWLADDDNSHEKVVETKKWVEDLLKKENVVDNEE